MQPTKEEGATVIPADVIWWKNMKRMRKKGEIWKKKEWEERQEKTLIKPVGAWGANNAVLREPGKTWGGGRGMVFGPLYWSLAEANVVQDNLPLISMRPGLYIFGDYPPWGISADVIWGKRMKRGSEKRENVKEKGRENGK
jgi:hypothetical protein